MKKLFQISNYLKSFLVKSQPSKLKTNINEYRTKIPSLQQESLFNYKYIKQLFFWKKTENLKNSSQFNKSNEDYKYTYYNNSKISEGLYINKIYCLFGLFTIMIYNKVSCFPASDKELEKIRGNLEKEIKNLEFKYQGKLRRQPVK